jgi:hypothetical protein
MHNGFISQKAFHNAKRSKEYTFQSGTTVKLQGYEHFALDFLLQKYKEDEIKLQRSEVPVIWYEHSGKNKRYFTDFFIPKDNILIEIKSEYTYKKELIKNILKGLSVRKSGYLFEIWIFDKNGKLLFLI